MRLFEMRDAKDDFHTNPHIKDSFELNPRQNPFESEYELNRIAHLELWLEFSHLPFWCCLKHIGYQCKT